MISYVWKIYKSELQKLINDFIKYWFLNFYNYESMKKNAKKYNFKLTSEKIHSLNIYIFLGFNLTLVSVLGFIWMKSSINNIV